MRCSLSCASGPAATRCGVSTPRSASAPTGPIGSATRSSEREAGPAADSFLREGERSDLIHVMLSSDVARRARGGRAFLSDGIGSAATIEILHSAVEAFRRREVNYRDIL